MNDGANASRRAARVPLNALASVVVSCVMCLGSTAHGAGQGHSGEPGQGDSAVRYIPTAEELSAAYQRAQARYRPRAQVYKARLIPHWFANNTHFWYRNDLRGGAREFILVDATRGQRGPAFDHKKLAAALTKATGKRYRGDHLPFSSIEFGPDSHSIRFRLNDATWQVVVPTYACTRVAGGLARIDSSSPATFAATVLANEAASPFLADDFEERAPAPNKRRAPGRRQAGRISPDGKWTAFVKDFNLWLRSPSGQETQLSRDGKRGLAYGLPNWAPDSQTLAAFRIEPGDHKAVYLIESSPAGGGRAILHTRPYDLPGDKLTSYELNLFEIDGFKQLKPSVDRIDLGVPRLHWSADGSRVTVEKTDRGHQRFRLIEIAVRSGAVRNIIDERSRTFIWTAHTESLRMSFVNWLKKTDEIIYASERDGWRHLYLIDVRAGRVKNQITRGNWVVRGINHIDEDKRQIWFQASGMNTGQDPYLMHYYRINFDGTHLVALTGANGNHTVQFSPDRTFLIDTYSRVNSPPVHELRRAADGRLMCLLEKADTTELDAKGWKPPEVFVAKGRDGKTDIWGIIVRPSHLDPSRKYPVIESIYAGPQGSFVPKSFRASSRYRALSELGFIVVQIDGMGTVNRSKAFHDVCWRNLKDAGFPDRIAWHRAVARKYPYYDLDRMGIYGTSAGGQNAAGALLFYPGFYKAAVAACGCHDNRVDKASWNEQWMGYPVGPQYAESSNITHAANLCGKLLLIVGELDDNVPPESTYRFADALIKAGKDFDFLVVPGMRHSNGGAYGIRRMQDFFVRHLLQAEPPDRNASAPAKRMGKQPSITQPTVAKPPESYFQSVSERDRQAARQFYKKYLDIQGLSVAASADVDNRALTRTYDLVTHLLAGRQDILATMIRHGTRLVIIGKDQLYTDIPEYRHAPNPTYLNERVRGTGGFRITSFGEENLLNLPLDRYDDESIAVHEFCHTIDSALSLLDPGWRPRLRQTYRHALANGLWKNTYSATNPAEYWAETCQCYFNCDRVNNWNHGPVGTREQLKEYDPEGYEMVKATFRLKGTKDWRYHPLLRQPSVTTPPAKFHIDPYYTKFTYAREFTVLGSSHVSDRALLAANDTIRKLFAYRHDILKALIADGARLVVLGRQERLRDLPEFKDIGSRDGFDAVRYLDYTPERKLMVVPEENVLGLPDDPFAGRCLVISVLARALHQVAGLRPVDPGFDRQRDKQQYELRVKRLDSNFDHALQRLYKKAVDKGLWKGTPAARNHADYWVAGVEAYFDAAGAGQPAALADHPITTREALKAYDPALFALVDETMAYRGHVDWRSHRLSPPASP